MPEAEDVITDVARHATVYAQGLWRRRRAGSRATQVALADVLPRIDLFLSAVFGRTFPVRISQPPARPTLLARLFAAPKGPWSSAAVPATDDVAIWLPTAAPDADEAMAIERFRISALQQAMRASRRSANVAATATSALARDVYLLLEAQATDEAIVRELPGLAGAIERQRRAALRGRPGMQTFPARCRRIELLAREILEMPVAVPSIAATSANESMRRAEAHAASIVRDEPARHPSASGLLWKDWWTGDFRIAAQSGVLTDVEDTVPEPADGSPPPRSARLPRAPEQRKAPDDEDDERTGAWMIQTAPPLEHAEDPAGMQRPTDRDADTAPESFADSLSELPEARLVSTPGRPREVLLSDDAPERRATRRSADSNGGAAFAYPEWDYRIGAYREAAANVLALDAAEGPQVWVDRTLAEHRGLLEGIRRRFEMLRPQRTLQRRQLEGDEIDLDAYIESRADFLAGRPLVHNVYQTRRRMRRNLAITLLIDVSGSTDGWIAAHRRIVDVEREALLLVSIALEGLGEPYSILAFSGEGPGAVTLRAVKRFDERFGEPVARRIAGLEPERYTRAGAAIRHATALLAREGAEHKLLLMLSDGKPNDVDHYEGRYGVEDMRQAIVEARLQGIHPFCLTIDRMAATYVPAIFGAGRYALLVRPERLPQVLLDWMKRLVVQ